jgi:radical SAM superfamily enzyme YgiQ (UPF0313 family)
MWPRHYTAGHHVQVLDLCWAEDVPLATADFFRDTSFGLVGVTLRNTDDCAFTSRQSFVSEFAAIVGDIRRHTDAQIVAGGVGFSVMPEQVLEQCERTYGIRLDAGVWGEGEFALVELAGRLEQGQQWRDLANLVWHDGVWRRNPPAYHSLADLPPMSRSWVDNRRYFDKGGQAGIETKRGCPGSCIYCADPLAKGARTRTRPPTAVVDELERLLAQGIDHIHTCDSEFNLPAWHALEICNEISRRGLGQRLRWYAYCTPASFTRELSEAMRGAGCVGVNFGVDHGDERMLRRLGRPYTPQAILNATRWCQEAGMAVMLDLLLGSPGETRTSLVQTIELMQRAAPHRVGISLGIRVYPGTALERQVLAREESASPQGTGERETGLIGGKDLSEPLFFLEPNVAPFCFSLLDDLIGDDPRFLFFDPAKPDRNYNYNANQRLVEAIEAGYRGAYWDILRRLSE